MAEPLAHDGPLAILEDAVRLLRQAPPAALICHPAGSVPFALALLLFFNTVTDSRAADSTVALRSLLLALALVWMHCWRAVYAGRLRGQLAGSSGRPWDLTRIWRLAAGQAFFAATKLAAVPLAALTVFPLPSTVMFFRTATMVAGHDDLDPLETIARARRLAALPKRLGWAVLPFLLFLQLMVGINLAIVLGILPQLVRILTGYESAFSRSGIYFVLNPLFAVLVFVAAWMAFDPFVQAVYCVLAFRAESQETGEDLRAGLRRLRAAAAVLTLLFVAIPAKSQTSPAVPAEELNKAVEKVMQSPDYDWRLPPPVSANGQPWIVTVTDRMIAGARTLFRAIGDRIERFLRWLFERLRGAPIEPGQFPARGLHRSLFALMGAVSLGAFWLLWRLRKSRRAAPQTAPADSIIAVRLDAEELSPDRLPEATWLELAERSLAERNFRHALRAFYLANLAWLGSRQYLAIHSGKTNREYELELRRRARTFPEACGLFGANVAAFERAWYGMHEVADDQIADYRGRMDRMKAVLAVEEVAA